MVSALLDEMNHVPAYVLLYSANSCDKCDDQRNGLSSECGGHKEVTCQASADKLLTLQNRFYCKQ